MIIAVDGTLASGKGTLAKRLATHFGLAHLDTGLLYRATGYLAQQSGVPFDAPDALADLAQSLDLTELDEDVLRTDTVAELASRVATLPAVRAALLDYQRNFAAQSRGAVLDGRDIGTVICPDADVKFWVDATPEIRAKRRMAELNARGGTHTLETVLDGLKARDARDKSRDNAPMVCAPDAIVLDTTHLNADEALDRAIKAIHGNHAQ